MSHWRSAPQWSTTQWSSCTEWMNDNQKQPMTPPSCVSLPVMSTSYKLSWTQRQDALVSGKQAPDKDCTALQRNTVDNENKSATFTTKCNSIHEDTDVDNKALLLCSGDVFSLTFLLSRSQWEHIFMRFVTANELFPTVSVGATACLIACFHRNSIVPLS